MMCLTELHTAVEYDLDVTTVVFNNRDYGTISQSAKFDQYTNSRRFEWESSNFVSIDERFGCRGVRVDTRSGLADAVATALDEDGPTLIDFTVPADEQSAVDANNNEPSLHVE